MLQTPQAYVDTLAGPGKAWLVEFLDYMAAAHGDLAPVMFRQRPMFRVGKSYVFFTVAQSHFTVHTLNFALIEGLKDKLPGAGFGRGSVKVRFDDLAAKPVLKALCDEVVRLNRLPKPPPVDTVPPRPYGEALAAAFSGGKAKWLPLYKKLRDEAKLRLPEFTEYFPAANLLWKHRTTFAGISAVAAALRVEFYADRPHPELGAIKVQRLSKNRTAHTVQLTNASQLDEVLRWMAESYTLTLGAGGQAPAACGGEAHG